MNEICSVCGNDYSFFEWMQIDEFIVCSPSCRAKYLAEKEELQEIGVKLVLPPEDQLDLIEEKAAVDTLLKLSDVLELEIGAFHTNVGKVASITFRFMNTFDRTVVAEVHYVSEKRDLHALKKAIDNAVARACNQPDVR